MYLCNYSGTPKYQKKELNYLLQVKQTEIVSTPKS